MALSKSFKPVGCERSQGIPYKSEITDFVKESRKWQTLLSNCEAIFTPAVFHYNEKRELHDFVNIQLFSEKLINKELHKNDNEMIEIICEKIIAVSKTLNPTKIQLSVVWIYCFSYNNNEIFNLPIFKCSSQNMTNYVDIFSVGYDEWNHVLERAVDIKALLCFPRHGTYSFQNDQLDLEYVLSQCLRDEINSSKLYYSLKTKPFFQVALYSWFEKLNFGLLKSKLKEFIKSNWPLLIFCAGVEILGFNDFLMHPICVMIFKTILPQFHDNKSKITNLISEGKKLIGFLSEKKKLWIKIFESLSCFLKILKSMSVENITPSQQMNGTTPALPLPTSTSTNSISASPEKNLIKHHKSRQKSDAANDISVPFRNLRTIKLPENLQVPEECDTKAQKPEEYFTAKILENFLLNLPCLKAASSSDTVKSIPNNDQNEWSNNAKRCIDIENYILAEEKKMYKIYLCSKQYMITLIENEFAGKKITLEMDESGNFTLFDSQGISVGKCFFPLKFYGMCLFF